MERSLLLAQYDTAAQQARAVVEECCDDDGEHALVKERALYILVQALCLDTRHQEALQALDTAYSPPKRIPARLLALWWLLTDTHVQSLDAVLQYCTDHRTDDEGALVALLVSQTHSTHHKRLASWLQTAVACSSSTLDSRTREALLAQLHPSHQDTSAVPSSTSTSSSLSPSASTHGDGHAEAEEMNTVESKHNGHHDNNRGDEARTQGSGPSHRHAAAAAQSTPQTRAASSVGPRDGSMSSLTMTHHTQKGGLADTPALVDNPALVDTPALVDNPALVESALHGVAEGVSSSAHAHAGSVWEQQVATHTAHVQHAVSTAWHSAQQMLFTQEGATAAAKVGVGVVLGALLATAAYQERKPIARAVRRASSTLRHELTSTLGMAFGVVPNPIAHGTAQLRSRL